MLGELVGRGELRRSIGMVSLNFCFIPLFLSPSLHDLLLKDYIKLSMDGKGTQGVFFYLAPCFSLLFFVYQNQRDRSDGSF